MIAASLGVLLAACSTSGSSAEAGSTTTGSTAPGSTTTTTAASSPTVPADRPIDVAVPKTYRPGSPAPLLVLLHGYTADGKLQGAYLHMPQAADAAGMLYVAPDGTKNALGNRFWNATDACCAKGRNPVDDSTYLLAVIDQVKAQYDVDPKRVFVVGHSNGGFMSYRMACDHADVIAAVASIEGATWDDPSRCQPSAPVSALEIHGTADETIAYDGGSILGSAYPSATQTVKTWAGYDGCDPTPVRPAPADRRIEKDHPPATVTRYGGCRAHTGVELWTQPDGTHIPSWTDDFSTQIIDWLQAHPKA